MYTLEEVWKRFTWGISILDAYFSFNSKENLHDINIFSESFACDLINIIWEYNAKTLINPYNPGYDLIDTDSKTIFQVSSSCSPRKVIDSFESLKNLMLARKNKREELIDKIEKIEKKLKKQPDKAPKGTKKILQKQIEAYEIELEDCKDKLNSIIDIEGYHVRFFFFAQNAKEAIEYSGEGKEKYNIPQSFVFNKTKDLLSLGDLPKTIQHFSIFQDRGKIDALESFMKRHNQLFSFGSDLLKDKVTQVISEYSDNYEAPLFLHKTMNDTRITLQNTYIEPHYSDIKVSHANLKSTIDRLSETDTLTTVSLLDTFLWYKDNIRLLFIDGAAAIGKTSFISWLCYHYLHKDISEEGKSIFALSETKLVVVRLRDLSIEASDSAEKSILRYLGISTKKEFEDAYKNSFIVLDGADELSFVGGLGSITIEQFILSIFNAFPRHKIMVTSRPHFIEMSSFQGATRSFSYIHCNIKHFSQSDRTNWINAYEKAGGEILENTKEYLLKISDKDADGVADTPLALYLLAACDFREEMRDNKWILFHEIFHNAIRSTDYNSSFQNGYHKKLTNDVFAEIVYETIGRISNRMYQNMKEERYYILSDELDAIIQNHTGVLKDTEAIKKTCVLCAYWKENTNIGALEFYHNDIRDFFLCEYLYKRFNEINFNKCRDDILLGIIKTACDVFQFGVIANTTWAQAFSFFYNRIKASKGLAASNDLCCFNINGMYKEVIYRLLHNKVLWNIASEQKSPYDVIKSVVYNTLLFLKIWGMAISVDVLPLFFEDDTDDHFWIGKGIFYDWDDIFLGDIKISDDLHLSVGSYSIISNLEFKSYNLNSICFESSKLMNVDFKTASLIGANFRKTKLKDVNFSNVNLSGADYSGAVLENVKWSISEQDIARINLSDATIISSQFVKKQFDEQYTIRSVFIDCSFESVKFANTKDTKFKGCIFKECSFENINNCAFSANSKLSGCTFSGDILNVSFNKASLQDISCHVVDLDSTSFKSSKLKRMHMQHVHFGRVKIEKCVCGENFNLYGAEISLTTLNILKDSGAIISGKYKLLP